MELNKEQKNRTTHVYGQPIFDEVTKAIEWRKDNLSTKWCWDTWMFI